ncbi:hypothetical protein DFH27DRAFT_552070 [Peziza echinospora]|nr:hypothetical protein DFH27DRAFT_552070 [Peziza echinospora]
MASKNPDSTSNQGEFHARRAANNPTHGSQHQTGSRHIPSSQVPEFHAETLPPNTPLPPSNTFSPNNDLNLTAQDARSSSSRSPHTSTKDEDTTTTTIPGDTAVPGATSADVNRTFGRRVFGASSTEDRHDMQPGRKGQKTGLARFGKAGVQGQVDPRDDAHAGQRALDKDAVGGTRSTKGQLSAGEIPPQQMATSEGRHAEKGKPDKPNKRQATSIFTQ